MTTLAQEVQALRETVERLINAQRRVSLSALPSGMFLGQPVTVIARVTDANNVPIPDAPLTMVLSWGRLRAVTPTGVLIGDSLNLRTGADGTVRVLVQPPLVKDLYDNEQSALQSALRTLNANAPTPRMSENELFALTRHYRWEASVDLRQAVDAYFRQFYDAEFEARYDVMASWTYVEATLIAYVASGDGTQTQGSAVLTFSFKNWLPPWLEVYSDAARKNNSLSLQLEDATRYVQDAPLLRDILYARTRNYVNAERGLVGEFVTRKVADTALQDFVNTQVGKLPLESRVGLIPSASTASNTIRTSGANVLAAISKTEVKLERKIATPPPVVLDPNLGSLIDNLRGMIASKVDEGVLNARLNGLESSISAQFDSRFDQFAAANDGRLDDRLSGLENRFDRRFTEFERALGERGGIDQGVLAELERGIFIRVQEQFDARLTEIQRGFDQRLENVLERGSFAEFEQAVERQIDAKLDRRFREVEQNFEARLRELTGRDALVELERRIVARFEQTMTTRLTDVENRLAGRLTGIENTITTRFTGLETNLRTLEGKTARIDTTISGLETNVRNLRILRGPGT